MAKVPTPILDSVVVSQISILVPDLEEAVRQWTRLLGRSDWRVVTYSADNVRELRYHGQVCDQSMRLALIGSQPQIELIQPLRGPSIYHDWIDEHGYGMHHLGFWTDDVDALIAEAETAGIDVIQSGHGFGLKGDGGWAYLDTIATHGAILEGIEIPKSGRRVTEALPTLQ